MKRLLLLLFFPAALLAQQPSPELSITANGTQTLNLYSGWPLIVRVTIQNSLRFTKITNAPPLVIAPNGSAWTNAIQFTAVSSSGQPFQWALKLAGTPADVSLTLRPTSYVRATWQLSPADVSALPPDSYVLTASLQVSGSSGWNGMAQSKPVTIQVGAEPTLTSDQQTQKALLISEYDTNLGDLDGALATVRQLLQAQPNNPSGLSAAANLLQLRGYPDLAFFQAGNALTAYYQAIPDLSEAPSNLLAMYQELFTLMLVPLGSSASPTTTQAAGVVVPFSATGQTVTLTATVSSTGGSVEGGTVTFTVSGVGNAVTSAPVTQGNANVLFTIPGGTPAGSYTIQASYSGTVVFSASTDSTKTLTIQ